MRKRRVDYKYRFRHITHKPDFAIQVSDDITALLTTAWRYAKIPTERGDHYIITDQSGTILYHTRGGLVIEGGIHAR